MEVDASVVCDDVGAYGDYGFRIFLFGFRGTAAQSRHRAFNEGFASIYPSSTLVDDTSGDISGFCDSSFQSLGRGDWKSYGTAKEKSLRNIMDYSVNNLQVYFPKEDFYALRDVSIKLKEHSIFALVGETGSGKTMISRAISGMLPKEAQVSGEVMRGLENLLLQSDEKMRKYRQSKIAMVFQNASAALNPLLSLERQLRLSVERKVSIEELIELMRRVQLSGERAFLKLYPFELSGGMKQRFLLAMALLKQPELLILDEPTRGMDFILREEIFQEIRKIHQETSVTVLLITHDLPFARALSNEMAVLYHGQVVECGETKKLFAEPKHPYFRQLISATPEYGFHVEEEKSCDFVRC